MRTSRKSIKNNHYGVAMFDNPRKPEHGIACVAGQEAFEFTSTGSLSKDTYWFTNIPTDVFNKLGLGHQPKFRHEYFFRTRIQAIKNELGLGDLGQMKGVEQLSHHLFNCMNFAEAFLDIDRPPAHMLSAGIAQLFKKDEVNTKYKKHFREASQSLVKCERPRSSMNKDLMLVTLLAPRKDYCKFIVNRYLPRGHWQSFTSFLHGKTTKDVIENIRLWESEAQMPVLAQVEIRDVYDETANLLLNHGAGSGFVQKSNSDNRNYITFNDREWLTAPELLAYSEVANLTIKDLLIGESYCMPGLVAPNFAKVSYAEQLFCENYWVSLTRNKSGNIDHGPTTAWVLSNDRSYCYKKARQLFSLPEVEAIASYGYGRVTIMIDPHLVHLLPQVARKVGMIAPAPEPDKTVNIELTPNAEDFELLQVIQERRKFEYYLKNDEDAINAAHLQTERMKSRYVPRFAGEIG